MFSQTCHYILSPLPSPPLPSQQASADPSWEQSMEQIALHPELNYLTQIVVLLFEDMSQPEGSDTRYCVDLLFSPGVKRCHDVASLSEPTKSASTSSLLKGSPELKRKSLATHWVKRLPPISVKRGLEDDTQASTVSSVLVASHFGPEPHGVPRSLSDSCVTERMPSTGGRAPTSDVALSCSPDFAPDLLVAGLDHHHLSGEVHGMGRGWLPCSCQLDGCITNDTIVLSGTSVTWLSCMLIRDRAVTLITELSQIHR